MTNAATPLDTLARQVSTRLHTTPRGVCTCGPCNHQIHQAARRGRTSASALRAALEAQAKPVPARPVPVRRPLTGRIGAVATISVDGARMSLAEGLSVLAQRSTS